MKVEFRQSNGYTYSYLIDVFLESYKVNSIVSLNYPTISSNGSSSNRSFRRSILGSIGESFERQTLLNFSITEINKEKEINCVNMVDEKFETLIMSKKLQKYFYDTCGLATHVSTEASIENAFKEFVERQSFILSYLSKEPKRKIIKNEYFFSIVPKEFEFLNFYEISIIENYKVVFCIGQKASDSIDIGLGAGYSLEEALNNLMNEVKPFRGPHGDPNLQKKEFYDYIDYFNMIPIPKIIEAYRYLDGGEHYYPKHESEIKERKEVVEELYRKFDMDIFMCTMFSKNNMFFRNSYSKNIKIFALGWFPSLNVRHIDEDIYINIEKKTNLKLDREINVIPFP